MSQAKHTTAARSQFAKEFAAALSAIKTLDSRDSAWASVPLPKRKPTAAEILRAQPAPPGDDLSIVVRQPGGSAETICADNDAPQAPR